MPGTNGDGWAASAAAPLQGVLEPPPAERPERRRYFRLSSILPLELQFESRTTRLLLSTVLQGYTQDVGRGGLCIELFRLTDDHLKHLNDPGLRVKLRLYRLPFQATIQARGRVVGVETLRQSGLGGYRLRIAFEEIDRRDLGRLLRFARRVHWMPRLVAVAFAMLVAISANLFWQVGLGARQHGVLVVQLHHLTQHGHDLQRALTQTRVQWQALKDRQETPVVTEVTVRHGDPARSSATEVAPAPEVFSRPAPHVTGEPEEPEELATWYRWLRDHQYPMTGLVVSYEGDGFVKDWAFTYDQAVAAQCFLLFGDDEPARRILEFYATHAERVRGGFVNAYDVVSGRAREYAVHVGPNLWLGVAALQYTHKTNDQRFLPLARSIGEWVRQLQQEDPEGGIRGGPHETWFSTEHNLDAYAFFQMLAKVSGESSYHEDGARVLRWLQRYAHGRLPGQINRGRGDATIATDTFAWAIAAVGPEELLRAGFDPDRILTFAKDHCAVRTTVHRPGEEPFQVEGFDFSKPRHLARGGIVSTEWTGQMIVSLKLMALYHQGQGSEAQAERYLAEARHYQEELRKLAIQSPCPLGYPGVAFPYATHQNVDTGHGWRTPHGNSTGSISGTVYAIFAFLGYNPLRLFAPAQAFVTLPDA